MNENKSSIVPVIQESERVLGEAIKHFGLTVKPEQICLTVQAAGRKQALGWFGPDYWSKGKAVTGKGAKSKADAVKVHEINLSAEHLKTCDVGELIIHELAHAENEVLGIRDCANRVHNKKFKVMAEKLGLIVKPRDSAVGFGYTELGEEGKKFLEKISFKREIFDAARIGGGARKKGSVGSRLIKLECAECGYVARTTQKWLDDVGPCHCPEHGEMAVDL